jgi:hypothetical protein
MMKLLAVIVLLLAGCASVNQGKVSPRALDAQEKWLRGLARGQPIQETTVSIVPGTQYLLETFQHETHYQYISGMYPITGTPYGLYFEGGRLEGLLLGEDVEDFYHWEYYHRVENDQWLRSGMAQTTDWVETRDVLGRDFDARATHHRDKIDAGNRASPTGGDSIEIIATLFFLGPVLLAVAPIYMLSGGAASDDKSASKDRAASETVERERADSERAERQRTHSFVGKLHPGSTTSDDILSLMGPPEFTWPWKGGKVWAYDIPKIYIGTADGIVVWKEISGGKTPHE